MPFDSHKVGRLVAEVMRVRAETGIEPVCVCNAALLIPPSFIRSVKGYSPVAMYMEFCAS